MDQDSAGDRARLLEALAVSGLGAGRAAELLCGDGARALGETLPHLVWTSRDGGRWDWAGKRWRDRTGQDGDTPMGTGWLDAAHPDDRRATMDAWASAPADGVLDVEHRVRGADGYRWHRTRALPSSDGAGRAWHGTCTDVHELREARDVQAALVAELQDRVRNNMVSTRAIVARSLAPGLTAEEAIGRAVGRVGALARVHAALTETAGRDTDLAALARRELAETLPPRVARSVAGSSARLGAVASEAVALALHELAANAASFGATEVRVAVGVAGDGGVSLEWREPGGHAAAPGEPGFGLDVVRSMLPCRTGGTVDLRFGSDGLTCSFALPARSRSGGSRAVSP